MQTNKTEGTKVTILQVMKKTVKHEGVRTFELTLKILGFYKGFCPPLATGPMINAVVFMAFEFGRRFTGVTQIDDFTVTQMAACGAFAGAVESFLSTPVDLVKCRLQVQRQSKSLAYYKGPIDCLRKVVHEEGLQGLYRGQVTMLMREMPLFATQFGTYFLARKIFAEHIYHCKIDDLKTLPIMISGGFSGFACWCVAYPLVRSSLTISV